MDAYFLLLGFSLKQEIGTFSRPKLFSIKWGLFSVLLYGELVVLARVGILVRLLYCSNLFKHCSIYNSHPHIPKDENSMKTITTTDRVERGLLHAWNYMLHLLSSLICWMHEDVTRIRRCTLLFLWLKTFRGQHKFKRTICGIHSALKPRSSSNESLNCIIFA